MRMVHYFAVGALLLVGALLATAATGLTREPGDALHVKVGLVTAVLAVGTHTLVILFMIVTGRVLRAAMESRPLGPEFLAELNVFFSRKKAYPLALLAATFVVTTAVLGYGQRAFGTPATLHLLLGVAALTINLWALGQEARILRDNQALLDRAARELDRLDRETPRRVEETEPEFDPAHAPGRWVLTAFVAWLPYLYWGLINHRGDFGKISWLFPAITAAVSVYALLAAWGARALVEAESPSR